MIQCFITDSIKQHVPNFKMGIITYNNITIDQSPKMLKGRYQTYQQELNFSLEEKALTDFPGIKEWRETFKSLGIDPSRYRPSQEALYRRIQKGQELPSIHSAVDVNNLASLVYQLPLGIYDLDKIEGNIDIGIGKNEDGYEAINGHYTSMEGKLQSKDQKGSFGSPIVDSLRTMVTEETTNALHVLYLKPSTTKEAATKTIEAIGDMFTFIHGGDMTKELIL